MMNSGIYEAMENEFEKKHIEEEVEDVLLDMAEMMADRGVVNKEINLDKTYGRTHVSAWGSCTEEEGEISVYIRCIWVGKKEFEIKDYFL